jgi:phage-related protein (TIGR01555 family)
MWRADDLAARAVEGPPADAFRMGYEIVIGDEGKYSKLKEDVEDKLVELDVDSIVERAFAMERALGGGAILLGVDDGQDLKTPIKLDKVNGIDWLTLLEPMELLPARYYEDPTNAKYGEPEFYQLNTYMNTPGSGLIGPEGREPPPNQQLIHESRLIVFRGIRVSRYQIRSRDVDQFWGDSVLVRIAEILRDFNLAWHSAGIIVTDFSQSVYQIDNLMQLVAKSPEKFRDRMQAIELGRNTARAIVLDTKEKFERQSTSIAGLPELLNQLSLRLAAAVDMPLSLLMGQAPKGLGADSEGDLRMYYDKIRSFQRRKVGPILKLISNMVMKSMRERGIPKKWSIRFNPLWQLTDAEIAEARLTQARSDSMYIKMGSVTPDEIRQSRFHGEYSFETQVEEHKPAPGFLAPLPAGVMPGSTPAAGMGPNAHSVGGYARRNPTQKGLGANASEGGDVEPRTPRDQADGRSYLEHRNDKWYLVSFEGEDLGEYVTREDAVSELSKYGSY